MAILAANVIAQRGTADHEAAGAAVPAAGKAESGLEALFSALLAASGSVDAKNGETAARTGLTKDVTARLAELLDRNIHIVVKTAAAGTEAVKPAATADAAHAAAKDKHARETGHDDAAQEIPAAPATQLASLAPASDIATIKKAPRVSDDQAAGAAITDRHKGQPAQAASRAPAQDVRTPADAKSADVAAKPATPDAVNKTVQVPPAAPQAADRSPWAVADAGNGKDLHAALAALQTHADKVIHQNIPAEKTAAVLPLQGIAATSKADGKGGDSASSDTGRDGTPSQNGHDSGPAKAAPASAPLQTATGNTNTATPDQNAASPSVPPLQGAPAHVSAALQVTPHSPVHPVSQSGLDNQPVPLSNLGALAVSIAARSEAGAKHFDIDLHPAELGSIHVRLSVDHTGLAQAHLRADTPQTLALLQRDSHTLERALKDAGLNLAGNGLNFSLKGRERETGSGPRTNARSRTLALSAVASTAPAGPASIYSLAPGGVRLDIRV